MIHFDQFTYTYPGASGPALSDVTLTIDDGAFVLVAGASGAGKSTLLRSLNGLAPHFTGGRVEGRLSVAGRDPVAKGPQALSRVVGFVFQDPEAQFVLDRVEDEIAFALENGAVPPAEMRARVEEALRLLDLARLRDRPLETLSGGEKQRVAIAAALVFRPRVLVLDEPTSQLDPQSADDVLQALFRLNHDLGLTIVLAEHRLERILAYVNQIIYLPGPGGTVLSGPPRRVLPDMPLIPPVVTLGKALHWDPLPLTVAEGRRFAASLDARPAASGDARRSKKRQAAKDGDRLVVRDLHFSYGDAPALRGVDLSVAPGELTALMGRNGSGKTTLLRCIVGLLKPQRGEIMMAGESLLGRETAQICRAVGYLPQAPGDLLFADSVAEELDITLRNHGLQGRAPIRPAELMARLGLDGLADRYPRDLSVGQRQRVALGAVTVTMPRLLLLDEPTRGLDYRAKEKLAQLLQDWLAEGVSVLLATHDVELAAQVADRVALLDQGRIVIDDAPEIVAASRDVEPALFAPQTARLFPGAGWLTAEDVLEWRFK
jgi:energy-coupling factor transport system ATP-binding protein